MAITTSSSISVKPDRVLEWRGRDMGIPHFHWRAGDVSPLFGGDRLLVRLLVQRGQVPDLDGPVATGRGAVLPVRAERHPGDEAAMTAEGADQLAGRGVPDSHGVILASRGDPSAVGVGAERHAPDLGGMAAQG